MGDILSRLDGVQKRPSGGYLARCPAHDDNDPSLSIERGTSQPVVLHCFSGCAPERVVRALGMSWNDLCEDVGHMPETSRKVAKAADVVPPEPAGAEKSLLEIERAKEKMTETEQDRYLALLSMARGWYTLCDSMLSPDAEADQISPDMICDCGAAIIYDTDPKRPVYEALSEGGVPTHRPRRLIMEVLQQSVDRERLEDMIRGLVERAEGRVVADEGISDLF